MSTLHYITGAAGTGKTRKMADALGEWFERNALKEHQSILALTKMHASRKHLCKRLPSPATRTKLYLSTLDSFALRIVNRWRLSMGFSSPVVPATPGERGGFVKDDLGHRATFGEILGCAAHLCASPTVAKTLANAIPLILVDEFQDCVGDQLSLIANLKGYIDLILAGDSFQALDGDESACDWARGFEGQESFLLTWLRDRSNRTECTCILEAADALIENRRAAYSGVSLPFFYAPRYALAAWKVIPPHRGAQTAALIYPANKALINLKNSVEKQNRKRASEGKSLIPFLWRAQARDLELAEQMRGEFVQAVHQGTWNQSEQWRELYLQARSLSIAKGHATPPEKFLHYVVNSLVQARKFVAGRAVKYEATTVHGAKNREFDDVFVLWDNNLCAALSDERKRRLLYNAITRARTSCTVIAIGTAKKIAKCPILSLLGESLPCFRR